MSKIRVTKIFSLEMAHALWNYNGACKNIHGHSYKLFVTLIGNPVREPNHPKNGMVIDFIDVKRIVKTAILDEFDHALIISEEAVVHTPVLDKQMFGKLKIIKDQPTVENLLVLFATLIKQYIPPNITLYSLKLQETESSYAEWFNDEN